MRLFMIATALFLFLPAAYASTGAGSEGMPWFNMITGLFFGLVLFLFGMGEMENALRIVAGDKMKLWLKRFTVNRFAGLATGSVVTAIIQSSSVTTVMLVSFVSAELMTFSRAIPVLFGANIGTTITAQLLAFKITHLAPLMGVIGFVMVMQKSNKRLSGFGSVFFGLALIFFGMSLMSDAMRPLRDYQPFMDMMVQMNNPWLGMIVAALFTALVQSSSATMGMIVVMALQGLITIEAGIALALGANIGTCVTAGFAAIGKSRPAVRVALAHVTFNVIGAMIFVWLIPVLSTLVSTTSGEVARQVANAHTTFNLVVAMLFLPFTRHLADFTVRMLPDRKEDKEAIIRPKYLVPVNEMQQPMGSIFALEGIHKEIVRMAEKVREMFNGALPAILDGSENALLAIQDKDKDVNILNRAISENILSLRHSLHLSTEGQMEVLGELWSYPQLLESAADEVKNSLLKDGFDKIELSVKISDETKESLRAFHKAILKQFSLMIWVIQESDVGITEEDEKRIEKKLRALRKSNKKIKSMQDELVRSLKASRFISGAEHRLEAYTLEMDIVLHLKMFYDIVRQMAKVKTPKFIDMQPVEQTESESVEVLSLTHNPEVVTE